MLIRFAPWMFAVLCSGGCSLILDTGDLPRVPDAPPAPDAPPVDGNRMAFSITGLWPDSRPALEGAGSKGIPIVLRFKGDNIIDPMVTAAWTDGFSEQVTIDGVHASTTLNEVDVGLRIPVRPDKSTANCATDPVAKIHFDFEQNGSDPAAFEVPLVCLDELTDAGPFVSGTLYSQITLDNPHHFGAGATAIKYVATADITINNVIDVDAIGQTPGPTGCAGGAPGGDAEDCVGRGDKGSGDGLLTHGNGGAGGGYFATGSNGTGGALGGPTHGTEMVVPVGAAMNVENRGVGGGGGGMGGGGNPGAGGGGGGAIAIIAGGELDVGPSGLVRAAGGNATAGGGSATLGSSGGGGGGSGGAIFIRAGAGVISSAAWLGAPKGQGGSAPVNSGGAGSVGRVRVDQPLASPAVGTMVISSQGGTAAGPAWLQDTVPFSFDGTITLKFRARPGIYGILINGVQWMGSVPAGSTDGNVTVSTSPVSVPLTGLERGYNTVCALYDALPGSAAFADFDEAKTCVDIVYTPGGQ